MVHFINILISIGVGVIVVVIFYWLAKQANKDALAGGFHSETKKDKHYHRRWLERVAEEQERGY